MPRLAAEHPFFFLDASLCFFQRRRSAAHVRRCVCLRCGRGLTESVTARAAGCLVAGAVAHLRSAYGKGGRLYPMRPPLPRRADGVTKSVAPPVRKGALSSSWGCSVMRDGAAVGGSGRLLVEAVLRALMMLEL